MFWNHVTNRLSAYCHDELSQEETRRVAEHLLHCPRCRKEYEEIKLGVQLASQLTREQAPASLWAELEIMLDQAEATGDAAPSRRRGAEEPEAARRKRFFILPPFQMALAGAAMMLVIGLGVAWYYSRLSRPSWEVTQTEGKVRVGWWPITAGGRLGLGEWLVTDNSSRAKISVGEIGQVEVEPNSQVKLVQAREDDHRLSLKRGKMHAFIWAPPRKFYVDTPSAVAVDLGCAYTLEVNDDGQGLLAVTTGWVAFEWEGRESFVPAGGMCVTRPGFGPGTPYFGDASDELKAALAKFDVTKSDTDARAAALDVVLTQARERDGLTLWHLLTRISAAERRLVYDRLAALIAPPPEVTREGVLRGDRQMLDLWWERLNLGNAAAWRMWKGPMPK